MKRSWSRSPAGPGILCACAALLCCLAVYSVGGQEPSLEPLFPVKFKHEFPSAHQAFEEVKGLILTNYYSDRITEDTLYWAAIKGMLRQISPPNNPDLATLWPPEEYDKVRDLLEGVHVTIGIKSTFNLVDGSLTVTEVLPDSPAANILAVMDRILRIDSKPLKGLAAEQVDKLLCGEEGSEVVLTVNRDIKIFDVTLTRQKVSTQTLVVTPVDNKVAIIDIRTFTLNLADKLGMELDKLKACGIESLIIDLRNNPGGVFAESLRTAELFLPAQCVLLRTVNRKNGLQNYVSTNRVPPGFKTVVLVNHKTSSGAEVLASALQDNQKATIVGVRTFGKGVFETTFPLTNGYRVKFITGAMYAPLGRSWYSKGVMPDYLVEQEERTVAAMLKLAPAERLKQDLGTLTAYKLLLR